MKKRIRIISVIMSFALLIGVVYAPVFADEIDYSCYLGDWSNDRVLLTINSIDSSSASFRYEQSQFVIDINSAVVTGNTVSASYDEVWETESIGTVRMKGTFVFTLTDSGISYQWESDQIQSETMHSVSNGWLTNPDFVYKTIKTAPTLWDVPDDYWAYVPIKELSQQGVINGYEDGSFNPEGYVTRAEWAKMLFEAGSVPSDSYVHLALENSGDLSKYHWASVYMVSVNKYLPIYRDTGGSDDYFPDLPATRGEVAISLVKYLNSKSNKESKINLIDLDQGSVDSLKSQELKNIESAIDKGLISGYEDGTIRINDPITRAEAAVMICRAFGLAGQSVQKQNKTYTKEQIYTVDKNLILNQINEIDQNLVAELNENGEIGIGALRRAESALERLLYLYGYSRPGSMVNNDFLNNYKEAQVYNKLKEYAVNTLVK